MSIRFALSLLACVDATSSIAMDFPNNNHDNEVRPPIPVIQQQLIEEDNDIQDVILQSIAENKSLLKEKQDLERILKESLETYSNNDHHFQIAQLLSQKTYLEEEFQQDLENALQLSLQQQLEEQQKQNLIENLTPTTIAEIIQTENLNTPSYTFQNSGHLFTLEMRQNKPISSVFANSGNLVLQALPNGNQQKKEYKITTTQSPAALGILTITKI